MQAVVLTRGVRAPPPLPRLQISIMSTQSERPRKKLSEFKSNMEQRLPATAVRPARKISANNDGSISDSGAAGAVNAGAGAEGEGRKRRPSLGQKFSSVLGLSRRSSSTSNLGENLSHLCFLSIIILVLLSMSYYRWRSTCSVLRLRYHKSLACLY